MEYFDCFRLALSISKFVTYKGCAGEVSKYWHLQVCISTALDGGVRPGEEERGVLIVAPTKHDNIVQTQGKYR